MEHGADPAATDPEFGATPEQWARFFNHDEVATWLAGPGTARPFTW